MRTLTAGACAAAVIALAGCGSSPSSTDSPSDRVTTVVAPTPGVTATAPTGAATTATVPPATQRRALRSAVATLDAYLTSWRTDGLRAATERYIALDGEPAPRATDVRLISEKIGHTGITSWESADRFTFRADLDLRFRGDPLAWGQGSNTRFVTATRPTTAAPFRLSFATSP